jgi:hypothetical protein
MLSFFVFSFLGCFRFLGIGHPSTYLDEALRLGCSFKAAETSILGVPGRESNPGLPYRSQMFSCKRTIRGCFL